MIAIENETLQLIWNDFKYGMRVCRIGIDQVLQTVWINTNVDVRDFYDTTDYL